jgi:acetylornithine deacetylase
MKDEELKKRLIQLTCDLVNIPTENLPPRGNEKLGQEYVKKLLSQMGCEILEFPPSSLPGFEKNGAFIAGYDYEGRNNVLGYIRGSGKGRSVLLTGHMDVAPREPLCWTHGQPFESVVEGNRIYGRGSADMKGGLACAIAAIQMLLDEGFQPKGDIIFESVVDEEYASGAGTIASRMMGYNADFGIIFEPTGHNICPACVGSVVLKVTVEGIAGMPYTGEKIENPVYLLSEAVGLIREYDKERLSKTPVPPLWENTPQAAQIVITKAKSGEVRPHGQLSTPVDAWLELVIQTYPGETLEAVTADFEQYLKWHFSQPHKITLETEYHYCKPSAPHADTRGMMLLKEKADRYTEKAKICGAMFSCDLFAFEEFGNMPAVVFGPSGEKLHGPDEWVSISSMVAVTKTVRDFVREWCG